MSKRRVGLFAALIAAVAALLFISSGCGGGATKSGGLEKLDGPAILEKAKTAAAAKKSVHINIKQVESGATSVIDVGFADGASGGTFDTPEAKVSFTIIGDTIYVKGDEGFLKGILGQAYTPAIAAKVTGKYISGPKSSPSLGSLSDFADMSEILNSVLSPEGTVTAVGAKEIDGIDTIGISSKKDGTSDGALYVANDGTDLPVAILPEATAATSGSLRFDKWGTVEAISAPPADQIVTLASLNLD